VAEQQCAALVAGTVAVGLAEVEFEIGVAEADPVAEVAGTAVDVVDPVAGVVDAVVIAVVVVDVAVVVGVVEAVAAAASPLYLVAVGVV
jgi:hypothetical protein